MDLIKPGYTRVSEIVGQWSKYDGVDPEVIRAKGMIGTNVHRAISAYIKDGLLLPLSEREEPYFESFRQWMNYYSGYPFESELRLYDKTLKITGGIDLLIEDPVSKKFMLMDFKTSAVPDHFAWQLQGGLYHWLCQQDGFEMDPMFRFIELSKYGEMAKFYSYEMDFNLLNACMAAVTTYRFRQNFLT